MPNVTDVRIRSFALTGTIPSQLGDLSALISLSFRENALDWHTADGIGTSAGDGRSIIVPQPTQRHRAYRTRGSSSLCGLDMGSNSLHGTIPSVLGALTNMRFLNLAFNQLTGTIPTGAQRNCSELAFVVFHQYFSWSLALSAFVRRVWWSLFLDCDRAPWSCAVDCLSCFWNCHAPVEEYQ